MHAWNGVEEPHKEDKETYIYKMSKSIQT
jgi:hypothetical protein